MATEVCKKIMHGEIYEYFDFMVKNPMPGLSFEEKLKSPELVAFLYSKNFPYELYEYILRNFDRSIKTSEEAFKEGFRLRKEFDKGRLDLKVAMKIAENSAKKLSC